MPLGNAKEIAGSSVRLSDSKVSGFSILQAESDGAVTELLKHHPHHHAPGASIEVLEMMPIPGSKRAKTIVYARGPLQGRLRDADVETRIYGRGRSSGIERH